MNTPTFSPTHLLLVRHGETNANLTDKWQGSTDSPLNQRGRSQAEALARRLAAEHRDIATIYASPLGRAHKTAEIISAALGHLQVQIDSDLAEFDLGEWEGLSYEALRYEKRLWDSMRADPHFAPPGGESAFDFATRLLRSFHAIKMRHPGQKVVVVSHGGALATALSMLVDGDGSQWTKYQMDNCALTELVWEDAPRLVRFNDVSHLDGLLAPKRWAG
ncbi:MAG: histidine phosphatase family protein [Chloroflexi bacterium]|nr:histidine phosphatase family protein [Chloroflexota bacterium]